MDELGHILREARETKGLSLTDVQKVIRINTRFIESLEKGEYGQLPTPVHARGFLRNYARFLNLDPQPLLERLEIKLQQTKRNGGSPADPPPAAPSFASSVFFDPVNMTLDNGRKFGGESAVRLVIIIALIATIGLVGYRIWSEANSTSGEALVEGVTEALQGLTTNGELISAEASDTITATNGLIVPTNRNDPGDLTTLATPSATRPSPPTTMESIHLKLEITQRVWMEVTIDGDVVFSGIAKDSDPPYEWDANEEAKLVAGNANGIFITINDVPLGRLGAQGDSLEETWQTTN